MRKPAIRTKVECNICMCMISRSNITKHKSKCNGKPSWAIRKTNNLPIGEMCNRKNPPIEEVNWSEIQSFYDNNRTYKDICVKYGFNTTYVAKAIKLGLLKTRSRVETARIRNSYAHVQSPERRKKTSEAMRRAVLEGRQKTPRPYGKSMKIYKAINSAGEEETLHGGWEKIVADYLNEKSYNWNKPKESFTYVWENNQHEYFPDFYLLDKDVYIEVKGMETERDRCKWKHFTKPLFVIDKNNINDLNTFFKDKIESK